jgi:hypothetical protein
MRNGNYVLVKAPVDYPGTKYRGLYCYEHHLVFWKRMGRTIKPGEIVHHKNKDTHDNRLKNLLILSPSAHSIHHNLEKKKSFVTISCAFCGQESSKESRQINVKIKRGQTDFYCNRSCMAKHFGGHRKKRSSSQV